MLRKTLWTLISFVVIVVLGTSYHIWFSPAETFPADHDLYYRGIAADPELSQDEIIALVAKNLHLTLDEVMVIAKRNE